ncbi:MAG: aconitate hydratase [Candidatus Azotimanducaceae bacterium]
MTIVVSTKDGKVIEFSALARLDTPKEIEYYQHGGILQFVLRSMVTNTGEVKLNAY